MFTFAVNFGSHRRFMVMGLKGNPVHLICVSNNSGTVPATVSFAESKLIKYVSGRSRRLPFSSNTTANLLFLARREGQRQNVSQETCQIQTTIVKLSG